MSQNTRWVAAIKAEALREAIVDHEATYGIACSTSREWLRHRAANLEREAGLPGRWADLFDAAPDFTGGQDVNEYLNESRGEA